jgi:stress response protein YsnF
MAKTLVGLYDTLTDVEHVVQDLIAQGFSRSDIQVVAPDGEARRGKDAYVSKWVMADGGTDVVDMLEDLGVPTDEAISYAEGIRRGGALVVVESSDDWADRGLEIMNRLQPVDINERAMQWRKEGWTGGAVHAASSTATAAHTAEGRQARKPNGRRIKDNEEVAIPVVEEEISVGKREVERGRVRVHSRVKERPVEESVRLREEKVTVERRPANRPATEADLKAGEETIEITETVEEPVVSKRARVVEEVVVRKDVDEHTETVRGTARRKDVDIDRDVDEHTRTTRRTTEGQVTDTSQVGTVPAAATAGFSTYDADYRQHHGATFLNRGAYADYEPAYRYGYELGTSERYRGRDWVALEADARRDWEARQPGTWERFKDAIRYGWEKVRTGKTTPHRDIDVKRSGGRFPDFSAYDTDYRQHHTVTFLHHGAYEDYMPAYRYGYDLATDERYRGRDWAGLEADIRRGWETQRPGTWERFKDAIRYGWDKVRGRI